MSDSVCGRSTRIWNSADRTEQRCRGTARRPRAVRAWPPGPQSDNRRNMCPATDRDHDGDVPSIDIPERVVRVVLEGLASNSDYDEHLLAQVADWLRAESPNPERLVQLLAAGGAIEDADQQPEA